MRRQKLHLGQSMTLETGRDATGRFWIAFARGASMFFREPSDIRRWLKLPKGTASRDAFDSWIASLEDFDKEKGGQSPLSVVPSESSFDPLAHDKMVI